LHCKKVSGKGQGCFITTAVCRSFSLPDDCYELTAFRKFRDTWLVQQPDGKALIKRYYHTAPLIVAAIDNAKNSAALYRAIWDAYLAECLRLIGNGSFEKCKRLYIKMVETLEKEWR
jgi:hypothetical protein